jgi:hypothetical protein
MLVSGTLHADARQTFTDIHRRFDADGDGYLNRCDLASLARQLFMFLLLCMCYVARGLDTLSHEQAGPR